MGSSPVDQSTTNIQNAPVAEAAPPIKTTAAQIGQAKLDLRRQNMMKKNISSMTHAGETGGFKKKNTPFGSAPPGVSPAVVAAGGGGL